MGEGPCEKCGHDGGSHAWRPWWALWRRRPCMVLEGVEWHGAPGTPGCCTDVLCACSHFAVATKEPT